MKKVREFSKNCSTNNLVLKRQSRPFNAEECCHFFVPTKEKPCIVSLSAIEQVGTTTIRKFLGDLQIMARKHNGIDAMQVFESPDGKQKLWFHEGGSDGIISVFVQADTRHIRETK